MNFKFLLVSFLAILLTGACSTPKNITYFETGNDLSLEQMDMMKNYIDPTLKEGDVLAIAISAIDPAAVAPFNLPLVSFVQNGVVANATGTKDVTASQAMQTYTINAQGEINFPVIGRLKIAGMKKGEAIALLEEKISSYVDDPIVNMNISNYKVTVLGEVNRPGSFPVTSDRVSLLDALGYAGDMTIYGNRKNVKIIRDTRGIKDVIVFDLTNSDLLANPNFYLQQNDVVYVEPNSKRKKNSQYSQTEQFGLSVVTATASICSIILSAVISLTR